MSTVNYNRLTNLTPDYATFKLEQSHAGLNWYVVNFLPIPVKLYIKRWNTLILLSSMAPRARATLPPDAVEPEDVLHVFTSPEGKDGPDYEILRPVKLRLTDRMIRIGDVTYSDKHSGSRWVSSERDINSVRIHNRTTMPLDVYFRGGVIARIDGDDGMSYMAGSPNNVYVDNAGRGFQLEDELGFAFQYNKKQIGSVTLTDNFTTDIYVGVVTQNTQVPYPDISSYHI